MSEIHKTACNRDCPDACSLLVEVEDGRAVRLRGDPGDPVTRGFLCQRTSRFLERQYADARILSPLLRRDGALVPIGWNEALEVLVERLRTFLAESGPASILHYRSGGSLGILKQVGDLFFACLGPVTTKSGNICSGAGEAAQELDFGISESHDLFDLLQSQTILLWGKNPHTSSVHLLPVLREARRRGACIVGIDPVRTRAAALCDEFLTPRPGADFALAMGVARHLFESRHVDPGVASYCDNVEAFRALAFAHSLESWARQCDLEPRDLARVAEIYGSRKPGAILVGWGLPRRRNGARTVRALDALGAISGNLGVAGGGVSYFFGRRTAFDTDHLRGPARPPRRLSEARLGAEILAADEPPVRMAWVTAGNPVSMLPDSAMVRAALASREFTVVVDTHPTDTTDVADLVLPTLTLLEDDDLLGAYGNHFLRESRPALPPPANTRHELWIFDELARRLELETFPHLAVEQWKHRVMGRLEAAGVPLARLREGPVRSPFAAAVLFADRKFPTASGKVNLLTEQAAPPPATSSDYPMTLLAVSTPLAQSSQWAIELPPGPPEVRVHPRRGAPFQDGDEALLESHHGALRVTVRHDPQVRPDVALMHKGGMLRDGRCANLLIPAVETDHGGGAAYYDEPVRLAALSARDFKDPEATRPSG